MSNNGSEQKAITPQQIDNSIQTLWDTSEHGIYGWVNSVLAVHLAHEADEIPIWGTRVWLRDQKLRELIPTEPALMGALATLAARNAAMTIQLDGPQQTLNNAWELLHTADFGRGIHSLILKLSQDLYEQDNGAFLGVQRDKYIDGEEALKLYNSQKALPVVTGLEHLDAANCIRTGDPLYPVLYRDSEWGFAEQKLLPWHMVVPLSEMPSPIQRLHGIQYSAVTRVLKAAQFMRAATIYRREKVEGRQPASIYVVGGPSNQHIKDAINAAMEQADNKGLLRSMEPIIVASLDPTKPVSVERLDWASLPDGFDYDTELSNYITLLALCLLEDYQTFAPLSSGNIGTSQQSVVLERKGRGKGPGLWRKILAHAFNWNGILPGTIEFSFDETDPAADREKAEADKAQIDNVLALQQAGVINVAIARQKLNDIGILSEDDLAMLGAQDQTPDTTRTDEEIEPTTEDIKPLIAPMPVQPAATGPAEVGPVAKFFQGAWDRLKGPFEKASIETVVRTFNREARGAVAGYMTHNATLKQASEAFYNAVVDAWQTAAEQGYTDGGSDPEYFEDEELDAIEAGTADQLGYAADFWEEMKEIREDDDDPFPRVDLYAQSLRAWYADWKLRGGESVMLTWHYDPNKEHCATCADLDGQRHKAKWFRENGYIPREAGSKTLECGGWRCGCTLTTDDGKDYTL